MLYQPDNAVLVLQYLQRLAGVTNVSGQGKIGGISSGGDTRDDALSPTDDASGSVPRSDGVVTDGVATTQVPSSTLTDVMKFQLHQYRARLHIITRSLKACKREVKSALNLDNQSITALFLKSNFEYARRNYRKAIKLLSSCPTREPHVAGQSLAVMYYNNLAAVHLQMGKYALAELYCTKALAANEHEAGRTPPDDVSIEGSAAHNTHAPLRTKVADRLCELLYVRGLACLFQEQPERAFGFFKAALPQFSHNPRAWHRLAECCVQKHVLHVERIHKDGAGMFTHVGTALHRKTLVSSLDVPLSPPGDDAMSLSAAVMYLNNALALLHPESGVGSDGRTSSGASPSDTTEASDTRGGGGDNGSASSSNGESTHGGGGGGAAFGGGGGLMGEGGAVGVGAPSAAFALPGTCVSPVQDADVAVIRCHVLVNLAYAHLGTHNTYEALRYAQMVLAEESSLSVCPAGLKFLALLYSAECLIRQDRIPTAIQLLSPANIGDMLTSPATTGSRNTDVDDVGAEAEAGAAEERHQPVRALPAETAKATLLLNLAAAYCMSGACDQGAHCLAQVCTDAEAYGGRCVCVRYLDCFTESWGWWLNLTMFDADLTLRLVPQVGTLQRGTAAYRQATLLSLFLALSRGQHDLAMDIIERSKLPEATVAQ